VKRFLVICIGVLLVFVAAAVRVAVDGVGDLGVAREALAEGNRVKAQKHLLFAARAYLPLAGWNREAAGELTRLGEAYLSEARFPEAVAAFDDARGALHATAWLFGPDPELLGPADRGYARALASWKKQLSPSVDLEAETARYVAMASAGPVVSPWWSLVMGLSFLGYVAALAVLAWRWDAPGFRRAAWGAAAGASFGLWIVAMVMA
jgi:hypothetical protein